jgi:hypothetical protein
MTAMTIRKNGNNTIYNIANRFTKQAIINYGSII